MKGIRIGEHNTNKGDKLMEGIVKQIKNMDGKIIGAITKDENDKYLVWKSERSKIGTPGNVHSLLVKFNTIESALQVASKLSHHT